ncbi:DASS family sodium-coupled anion symporter [Nocardiopsis sp. EMB25]|uniref:SLC13 family permease n=1 Tax=Nocardiopsis sp. EMB25 TaxID=2835867 RepID=UPI002284DE9F|nr:DASS family sodium-coupled anion symporter [Nocardiopsis sp. EMB25]MCY9787038.1 DASS family sodium-coupled anion symporter [Nocardiopsis sp. EMB25]
MATDDPAVNAPDSASVPRQPVPQDKDRASGNRETNPLPRRIGLVLGPVLGLLVYFLLPDMPLPLPDGEGMGDLAVNGRAVAGITVFIATWWATEAIPIPVTSLVPLVAFPILVDGVAVGDVAPSYGSPTIFLFMGGFMLALAMQRWNLHKRIALTIVSKVGSNTVGLIGGFMVATAFISMWVSNTATTVMMLPVGLSVVALITQFRGGRTDANFATALMLGIAYAASIGSVATLIGTPPNVLMVAYLSEFHDITIGFGQWMMVGLPIAVAFLFLAWVVLARLLFRPGIKRVEGAQELIRDELREMGPISRPEKLVLAVFVTAALSWIFVPMLADSQTIGGALPWLGGISDPVIAMAVAVALFLIPAERGTGTRLLDWDTAVKLPWGILLLFGGGIAISGQFTASGLSVWIGGQVSVLGGVPIWVLVLCVTAVVLLLTELTSNTATTSTFLPVLGGVATGLDVDVLVLVVPAVLAATMAFMLPVATPPNAIAFGSGYVTINQMMRGGVLLNLAALFVVLLGMYALAGWALGIPL